MRHGAIQQTLFLIEYPGNYRRAPVFPLSMPFHLIAERLGAHGLCVWPNFLTAASLKVTRNDLGRLQRSGAFARASTGQGEGRAIQPLRRDDTFWLNRESSNAVQAKLWEKLDSLKAALNRRLFLGLNHFEGHYASYPAGGFYRRHRDAFRQDDARIVSLVLYLNQDWVPAHGGRLRVYEKNSHTDIDPVGGTLVCFLSRETEHEVLESHAPRLSFTGWFKSNAALLP